ncbi:lipoprotein LipL46 [Leptospira perolatii]|uniref:Lipoprotein LipL46 n=1 Tax=Leptospira perolatii TaxID=2023191 RepID=A0A2M9ZJ88_9LEPT|nr:lipoprotein LipL46 [Leptospira perolatii]PJZ68419.1 lipoprotein LipL46 [Leptospira perolatii]PJZ72118.1 lipoprotein LipL46 [Leptospira perolatii]
MALARLLRFSTLTLIISFIVTCASGETRGKKKKEYYERNGNQITVMGEAPIYNGDKTNAKQRALKDAKINAIRKIVGEEISNKSSAADGESLGSSLLSKTDAFVKSYDIVDEAEGKIDTQPILKLTVRCTVEESKISTAVESLLADVGNPRVVVIVPAKVGGELVMPLTPNNIAEAEIIKNLKKAGNKIIDPVLASKKVDKKQVDPNNVEGNPVLVQAQGLGAEVLIIGNVETEDQPVVSSIGGKALDRPLFNTAATGSYKVVLLWGDGKIVDSGSADGRAADITQKVSREKAVAQWAESVTKKVNKQLKDEWFNLTENNTIILRFSGLNADEATKFKDDLAELTAVKDVNVRNSAEGGSEWELTYPGKDTLFVEELVYKKDRGFSFLASKSMEVKSTSRGIVNLEFKDNK